MFAPDDLTEDRFLDGRLSILQPRSGYRAGVDPVLLAASVPAAAGQSVLELGCGAGVAILCLASRVPGLALSGLEVQPDYADLARRNAARNAIPLDVQDGDLVRMPAALRHGFHHVIANPPYFPAGRGTPARDGGRETALREATPLALWIDAGIRRLRPRGTLAMIVNADRLPEALAALDARVGAVTVLPIVARAGRDAGRVILRAVKGARSPFRLLPPFVLHEGAAHDGDHESYTPTAVDMLRRGGGFPPAFR